MVHALLLFNFSLRDWGLFNGVYWTESLLFAKYICMHTHTYIYIVFVFKRCFFARWLLNILYIKRSIWRFKICYCHPCKRNKSSISNKDEYSPLFLPRIHFFLAFLSRHWALLFVSQKLDSMVTLCYLLNVEEILISDAYVNDPKPRVAH